VQALLGADFTGPAEVGVQAALLAAYRAVGQRIRLARLAQPRAAPQPGIVEP
jgi:hypothetical protein